MSTDASAKGEFTIREVLFGRLIVETAKWRDLKSQAWDVQGKEFHTQRGVVRGIALALTKMFGNGYEPYWSEEVKNCEKIANRIAREWINDDRPEDDEYWHDIRHRFWRSASDASSPDQRELRRSRYRA